MKAKTTKVTTKKMSIRKLLLTSSTCAILHGCGAGGIGSQKPEENNSGLCKLNCDKAILGSNDPVMSIAPVFTDFAFACNAAGETFSSRFQWQARQRYTDSKGVEGFRPVPLLSFEVIGLFGKINTKSSQMCSDACGVMTIDARLTCPGIDRTSTTTVKAHSGALFSTDPMTITITGPTST